MTPPFLMIDDGETKTRTFHAYQHTLRVTEIPPSEQPFVMNTADGPVMVEGAFRKVPARTDYILYLGPVLASMKDPTNWNVLLDTLRDASPGDNLQILINSPGGLVSETLQLQSIINEYFPGTCMTVLEPDGASAGAFIWLMGDVRIVREYGSMMIHTAAGGAGGTLNNQQSQVDFKVPMMTRWISSLVRDTKLLSKKEFQRMLDGKEFHFGVDELVEREVATHVIVGQDHPITTEEYLDRITSPKKKKRKTKKKVTPDVMLVSSGR